MLGKVHSYETFGTVDGPGVRFIVFLQGCPMRCLYCHNPDTWQLQEGKDKTVEEVISEIRKYKGFIKKGGVTISGGEPLLQMPFVTALAKACKAEGLHVALDTSGVLFQNNEAWLTQYESLLEQIDLVLLDIKQIDSKKHERLTAHKNEATLAMAQDLNNRHIRMWVRYVLVPGYSDEEEDVKALKAFIEPLTMVEKVEVLPYHKMGISKYQSMNLAYPLDGVEPPSAMSIQKTKEILKIKK